MISLDEFWSNSRQIGMILIVVALLSLFIGFIALPSADNALALTPFINDTAVARVNITNFVPQVENVTVDDSTISPVDEIDLISGSQRKVWCNGTVTDLNGKDDIAGANATFYFISNNYDDLDDKNYHYSNSSCAEIDSGTLSKKFSCTFNVWFFANNGTWYCNMTAWDTLLAGQFASNYSVDNTTVQPLYALSVPSVISYGELMINDTSSDEIIENVTNLGNMDIDLNLYGYGGTTVQENNLSMICTVGNISVGNERFDITASNDTWSGMTPLSGNFSDPNVISSFNLGQRTDENINSTKNTYWKIKIPAAGVKGECEGTIVFNSVVDS